MVAVITAVAVVAGLWQVRTTPTSLERTMTQLEALAPELRQKICAHRCNSIAKYRTAGERFHCIEIDVVLEPPDGGPAAVYHPPADNHHGLSLEFLLANESLPRGKLWLDVKDLAEQNWAPFLEQLLELIPVERRADIVVETGWSGPDVPEAAAAFRGGGFLFSYYLPTEAAVACGATRSRDCDALRDEVLHSVALGFSHLSFDARAYRFVQSIRAGLPPGTHLLTWDLSRSWPQDALLREVELYIVVFPSPHST